MSKVLNTFSTAIICCLLWCNVHNKATAQSSKKEIKILAFGDSLTAGYRLPKEQSYPALLEQLLKQNGQRAKVVNAGVSGDTSAQGLRRVDWAQKSGPFDVVLIALGANDGLRLMPTQALESNLVQMIAQFSKLNGTVCLLGIKLPLNLPADYRARFEAIYPRLAKQKKLCYLPFMLQGVATIEDYNLEDQIHPNAKGQAIVAQNVFNLIRAFLR